jgi:antirestriction protein ArdC
MGRCYSYTTVKAYGFLNECLLGEPGAYITWNAMIKIALEKMGIDPEKAGDDERREAAAYVKANILKEEDGWKTHKVPLINWWITGYKSKDKDGNVKVESDGNEVIKKVPSMRYQYVINVMYTNLPPKKRTRRPPKKDRTAEKVMANYLAAQGIKFENVQGDRAYYSPMLDKIVLPKMEQFKSQGGYYSTFFHEAGHSTGHPSRLNRFKTCDKPSKAKYAAEELVAECTSMYLMNWCELENDKTFKNSVAYQQSWAKALKNDPRAFINAFGKADKSVKMILGMDSLIA